MAMARLWLYVAQLQAVAWVQRLAPQQKATAAEEAVSEWLSKLRQLLREPPFLPKSLHFVWRLLLWFVAPSQLYASTEPRQRPVAEVRRAAIDGLFRAARAWSMVWFAVYCAVLLLARIVVGGQLLRC